MVPNKDRTEDCAVHICLGCGYSEQCTDVSRLRWVKLYAVPAVSGAAHRRTRALTAILDTIEVQEKLATKGVDEALRKYVWIYSVTKRGQRELLF